MRKAPLLIRLFSYFFIFMGVVALGALAIVWLSPNESSKMSISFLTNKFIFTEHPILFTVTSLFFVFSGVTGFAIVMKRSFAYDLGIAYCIVGLILFSALIISRAGLINNQVLSLIIQTIVFGGFLSYLVRHRSKWKNGQQGTAPLIGRFAPGRSRATGGRGRAWTFGQRDEFGSNNP